QSVGIDLSAIMRQVYMWVALGLLVAFGVAYVVGNAAMTALTNARAVNGVVNPSSIIWFNPIVFLGAIILYFIVAFTLQPVIMRTSPTVGGLMYLFFTALFAFMMSSIFLTYTQDTIALAFVSTAATFGAMSVVGYTTKIDLSKMGSILLMALVGLIIATIVNIFVHSTMLFMLINYVGVLI